jgi:hypothetical protein
MKYIVELEPGRWLCDLNGIPLNTSNSNLARSYFFKCIADEIILVAINIMGYPHARVVEIEEEG